MKLNKIKISLFRLKASAPASSKARARVGQAGCLQTGSVFAWSPVGSRARRAADELGLTPAAAARRAGEVVHTTIRGRARNLPESPNAAQIGLLPVMDRSLFVSI